MAVKSKPSAEAKRPPKLHSPGTRVSERTRLAYREAFRALTKLASSRSVDLRGDKEAQVEATDAVTLALAALRVLTGEKQPTTYVKKEGENSEGEYVVAFDEIPGAPYKVREAARVVVGASPKLDDDAEPVYRVSVEVVTCLPSWDHPILETWPWGAVSFSQV